MTKKFQSLDLFRIPPGFRGRSAFVVQLWWLVQSTLFKLSPQFAYSFRAWLLRLFGAKIGQHTIIRPSASFTYPWKVVLGNNVWIGDDVVVYSLGSIEIGDDTVVSQRSYICAGDHDYLSLAFDIRSQSVFIGKECWLATDTFVAPGVVIGDGCVVGARSSVLRSLPPAKVCWGNPCQVVKDRPTSR